MTVFPRQLCWCNDCRKPILRQLKRAWILKALKTDRLMGCANVNG